MNDYKGDGFKVERSEFAQRIGNVVKLQLKEPDGTFKNHYHRYKTAAKAEYMYEAKWKSINPQFDTYQVWLEKRDDKLAEMLDEEK